VLASLLVAGSAFAVSVCYPAWTRVFVPSGTADPWEEDQRVSACLAISMPEPYSETKPDRYALLRKTQQC